MAIPEKFETLDSWKIVLWQYHLHHILLFSIFCGPFFKLHCLYIYIYYILYIYNIYIYIWTCSLCLIYMDFIGDCPLRHGMIPCRHVATKKAHGHPSDLPQLGQLLHGSACGSTSGSCRGEPWWPKDLTCESGMMLPCFLNSMKSMNSMNLGFTKEWEAVHYGKWRSAMIPAYKESSGLAS